MNYASHHSQFIDELWEDSFRGSRWFTRGWTLQELLAPAVVEIYSYDGEKVGDRYSLQHEIHFATSQPLQALRGQPLYQFSMKRRLSWMQNRATKREEDAVYSLLGIFGVYMAAIYGEGYDHAMRRMIREITHSSSGLIGWPNYGLSSDTLQVAPNYGLSSYSPEEASDAVGAIA